MLGNRQYGATGPTPPDRIADEQEPVSALVVSPLPDDFSSLRSIFGRTRWTLHAAATRRDAIQTAAQYGVAAMISEAELPDGDWREMLADLQSFPLPPKLIVTSRLADDRLWVEVLNLGGYDVLAQPFRPSEVIRVVSLAWRNWREARQRGAVRLAAG